MSRRTRALAFISLAVACAALAAMLANGYSQSVARSFGPLRPVVVASRDLPAGRSIGPGELSEALQLRRVPSRFVPPGALASLQQALGREPAARLPAGSYVLAAQLRLPERKGSAPGRALGAGRRPVEITVSGGEAVLAAGSAGGRSIVDVIVTSEPRGAGPGRTYVAAGGVRLIALVRRAPQGPGPASGWSATLALSRHQALKLIQAESFARSVRLLPRPR